MSPSRPAFVPTLAVLTASVLALSVTSARALPRFQSSHVCQETPLYASSAAVADFDHDGRPDIAVATGGYAVSGVTLFRGTVTGFAVLDTIPLNDSFSIAARDLDGDGKIDLVVGSLNVTYMLRGNGDLTFQPAVAYGTYLSTASGGSGLDLGDVTGDGLVDIVVCDTIGRVRVRPAISPGVFGPPRSLLVSGYISDVKMLDLDEDGDQDVVINHSTVANNELIVFLNLGAGNFDAGTAYPGTTYYDRGIAAGDVDGDGDPDLVGAGSLFRSHGNGTFDAGIPILPVRENSPLLVDLDYDGRLDLVSVATPNSPGATSLLVRHGNGDGSFAAPTSRWASRGAGAAVAVDTDADGRMDIVTCGFGIGSVGVFRGFGPPGLEPDAPQLPLPGTPADVVVGDATGDGIGDVVAAVNGQVVRLFAGHGDLTFEPPVDLIVPAGVQHVAIGDFDHDGIPDLVTANGSSGSISEFRGTGGGAFAPRADFAAGGTMTDVTVADVNGDGFDDAIAIGAVGVRLFPGKAGGGFGARIDGDFGGSRIVAGKLDGDALPDVVGLNGGIVQTYFGRSPGAGSLVFGSSTSIGNVSGDTPNCITMLDLDGDGDNDLLVGAYLGFSLLPVINGGAGNWSVAPALKGTRRTKSLDAGDVDGDGIRDAVSGGDFMTCGYLYRGTGTAAGKVQLDSGFGAGGWVVDAALGDLDGDGYPEMVTADDHTYNGDGIPGALSVMRNRHSVLLAVPGGVRAPASGLAISRIWPTVAHDALHVEFALPARGETIVEWFDVGGRRLQRESLGVLDAGRQVRTLTIRKGIPAGIVWLRLRQGSATVAARATVAR